MKNKIQNRSPQLKKSRSHSLSQLNNKLVKNPQFTNINIGDEYKMRNSSVFSVLQKKLRIIQYEDKWGKVIKSNREQKNRKRSTIKIKRKTQKNKQELDNNSSKARSCHKINTVQENQNRQQNQKQLVNRHDGKGYQNIKNCIEQLHQKSTTHFLRQTHKSLVIKSNSKIKLILKGKRRSESKGIDLKINPQKSDSIQKNGEYQILPFINKKNLVDKKQYLRQHEERQQLRQQLMNKNICANHSDMYQIHKIKKQKPIKVIKVRRNIAQIKKLEVPQKIDGWAHRKRQDNQQNQDQEQFDQFMVMRNSYASLDII